MEKKFQNKTVVIWGLGLHGGGLSAAWYCWQQGAKVHIFDLRTEQLLKTSIQQLPPGVELFLEQNIEEESLVDVDMVIKSPAIRQFPEWLKNYCVHTNISLFLQEYSGTVLAVTGTKGKSSVCSLLGHVFEKTEKSVIVAGNIRECPLKHLGQPPEIMILELSSWQLGDLKTFGHSHLLKPYIASITNFYNDHQNTYASFQDYIQDKSVIFAHQGPQDYFVWNKQDPHQRNFSISAQICEFYPEALSKKPETQGICGYFYHHKAYVQNKEKIEIVHFEQEGKIIHYSNYLLAFLMAYTYGLKSDFIEQALKTYPGLTGRLEWIATIGQRNFYNDTTSTIPEATTYAIDQFPKHQLILIVGGENKEMDYQKLVEKLLSIKAIVFLPGTSTQLMSALLDKQHKKYFLSSSMAEAVRWSWELSQENDIILLSPAAASSKGLFFHAFDRADQFYQQIQKLKH